MDHTRRSGFAAAFALAIMLFGRSSAAQSRSGDPRQQFETRAQLEAAARAADSLHRSSEVLLLQSRLQHGDFQEGDKIVLSIEVPSLSLTQTPVGRPGDVGDTVVVRTGKVVQFTRIPDIPDMSLEGVLRSELVDAMTAHLSKYLRNPTVRAVPLVRLAVLGAVGRPGWYSMASDVVLADVIMQAGGVNNESDVPNTVVRRAGAVIWTAADVRNALSEGVSLDRLNLRAGDEIFVATRRRWSVLNTVQVITALAGVMVAARAIH